MVSISKQSGEAKYDLADFIEFSGLIILIRVLIDFEFESFYSIVKVGTVGFLILLLLLGATHKLVDKSNKNKWLIYLTVFGNISIYSYAATYGVNCVYDNSEPKIYQAKVIGKSISRGRRHTTYYLKVEPWGSHHDAEIFQLPVVNMQTQKLDKQFLLTTKKGCLVYLGILLNRLSR